MKQAARCRLEKGKRARFAESPERPVHARLILFSLSALCILLLAAVPAHPSSKKRATAPADQESFRAPPDVRKTVLVSSNFERGIIASVLRLIDSRTGLECRLAEQEAGTSLPHGGYDLFLGTCSEADRREVKRYSSRELKKLDPSLFSDGVLVWGAWYSCLAINGLFSPDVSPAPEKLRGKLAVVNPLNDRLMWLILYTLYGRYGRSVLEDLNSLVPTYRDSRADLVFSVESGGYPAVLGVDGYFFESIRNGYPIELVYSGFLGEKYPVTTVVGRNIAWVSQDAENPDGAGFIMDFLASPAFRSLLSETFFHPPVPGEEAAGSGTSRAPAGRPDLASALPVRCDTADAAAFDELWNQIAFPEIIREAGIPQ
jgi:hypothetical protein